MNKIADEIVIVDGESTDNTVAIAKKYSAMIISTSNKKNFHINKQKAIKACTHDWVLLLDADEVVTPKLAKEISKTIHLSKSERQNKKIPDNKKRLFELHQKHIEDRDGAFPKNQDIVAYFIARKNMFLGKALLHGGVYPDGVIRLFRKSKAHLPAKDVHEQLSVDGSVSWLEHDLLHYDSPTFSRYLKRANRYTYLTSKHLKDTNVPLSFTSASKYLLIKPTTTFLQIYFRHKAILDGIPGLIWAVFSALHHPIAYMKYWEHVRTS